MAAGKSTGADVRAWAQSRGLTVGSRGRLSAELIAAFNKAHPRKKYAVAA